MFRNKAPTKIDADLSSLNIYVELNSINFSPYDYTQVLDMTSLIIKTIFTLIEIENVQFINSLVDYTTDLVKIDFNSIAYINCNIMKYFPKCTCI